MQSATLSETLEEAQSRIRRRSAGVIVSRGQGPDRKFLILRAWRHWDFPKGAVEEGETEIQAAIRETAEETALDNLVFSWGQDCCSTAVYSRDKIASYFLADSPQGVDAEILRNPVSGVYEHDELKWVSWEELPQFLPPRLHDVMRWAAQQLSLPVLRFAEPSAQHAPRTRHSHVRAISLPEPAPAAAPVIDPPRGAFSATPQPSFRPESRPESRIRAEEASVSAPQGRHSEASAPTRGALARDADGKPERKERRDQFGRIVSRTRKSNF